MTETEPGRIDPQTNGDTGTSRTGDNGLTASAVGVVAAGVAGAAGHNTILPERGSRKLAIVVAAVALGALIYDIVRHRRATSWSDKVSQPTTTLVDRER